MNKLLIKQESAYQQSQSESAPIAGKDLAEQLPTFDRLTLVTKDIHTAAEQNGLTISDATFKPAGMIANTKINKMEIELRLKGAYLPLKNLLSSLLAMHDGLSLESISIQRARATDLNTDAEIRLNFFYRDQK